jgi:hypothetical protein
VSARSLLAAATAVALAACGGATPPQEVALEFLRSREPAKCRLVLTEVLERQTGLRGAAARRFCEKNVGREPPPGEVTVIESEIRAGVATVEVVVSEREERLELVKRDGEWRISAFPE